MNNQQLINNLVAIQALEHLEENAVGNYRIFPYHDPFLFLTDVAFRSIYRLTKAVARNLIEELTPFLVPPNRSSDLSISRKVLTALRFYASGSYQLDVGNNINNAVSQSSVSKCIEEVSVALNNPAIFQRYIKFPQNFDELQTVRNNFFVHHNFPGVIGCVDCTHVAIFPPIVNDPIYPEHIYLNRKGYHSINVQLICDTNLKILNVCARYPGSSHDTFIWNNTRVSTLLQNLHRAGHKSYYLLGDSGYPLRSWLLTPVDNPEPDTPEFNYNRNHRQTRSLIERCNGVLKTRFRCLLKHRVLHYKPNKASLIINACVVLHNICIENNIPEVNLEEDEQFDFGLFDNVNPDPVRVNPELQAGRMARQRLIRTHFTN